MLQDEGESGPFQCDPRSSSMMASMRTELPQRPDKPGVGGNSTADFRGSSSISSSGARSWLQRSHIQRDEAEPPRHVNSSQWSSRRARPSASAMVLARKRKRDEQRRLLRGKRQCTDSDSSECNAGDSERESLDMEEQLTAFVEYNATDMDSLDINPSQDFDGDEEISSQASQCMQTCGWEDVTDVNQIQEEASEVFDNVIYAPWPPAAPVAGGGTSTNCRPQGNTHFGTARSSFLPPVKAIPVKRAVVGPPSDDGEGSLSDGLDVATKMKAAAGPPTVDTSRSASRSKPDSKPQWRQRRSVKRDCSFLDSSNVSVNGRLLLMALPTPATPSEPNEVSSDRVIELKDGCFDSSNEVQEVPTLDSDVPSTVPSSVPATVDTMTVMSPSSASSSLPLGFQPRLVRKRRKVGKVGQLTLDGFFRSKRS